MWPHHDRVLSSNIERIDSIPLQSHKSTGSSSHPTWSFEDNELLVGNSLIDPSLSQFYSQKSKVTLKLREPHHSISRNSSTLDLEDSQEMDENCCEKISGGRYNLYFYMMMMIVSEIPFGLFLPALWIYCQYFETSWLFYGCLMSGYAGGGVIGSLLFYWLSTTFKFSQKKIFFLSLLIECVGSLLYALTPNKWILLSGVILIGISGSLGDLLPRLKLYLDVDKPITAKLKYTHYFTRIIGSGLGILFSYIPVTILFPSPYGQIIIAGFNACGFFLIILIIIVTILMFVIFSETRTDSDQDILIDPIDSLILDDDQEPNSSRNDSKLCYFFLFANWILYSGIYILFVMVTPFTVNAYEWTLRDTSLYWGCVLAITLAGSIIISFFRHTPELLLFSIAGMIAAFGIMLDFTQNEHVIFWRFVVGSGLVSVCFMIASELLYYLLQVLSVPYIINYWIGSKYFAKLATPVWVMVLMDTISESWIFVIAMSSLVLILILFVYFFRETQRKLHEYAIIKDGLLNI